MTISNIKEEIEPDKKKGKGDRYPFLRRIGDWFRRNALHILLVVSVLTLIIIAMSKYIFITIGPGERGVMFRRFANGTVQSDVYGEGLKMIPPWDILYIYNTRQQTVSKKIHVLSEDGLSIRIELVVRYHPVVDSLGVLHVRLGPDYPNTVIIPEMESSARKIIGQFNPHEFYTIRRDSIERAVLADTRKEFGDLDIVVHDVMIKDISLPSGLNEAIERKLVEEQNFLAYKFVLKAEREEAARKLIEARGIKAFEDSSGLSILKWKGIEATENLANSENTKVVIVGTGEDDLPVILGD